MSSFGHDSVIPDSTKVRFGTRRCNGTITDTIPQYYVAQIDTIDLDAIDVAGSPGFKAFRDDALGLFNVGAVDPSNKAALDALATAIAEDFCKFKLIHFDEIINGIVATVPDGLTYEIEWYYGLAHVNPSSGGGPIEPGSDLHDAYTRRKSAPLNNEVEEMHHHDPAEDACTATSNPCIEAYAPSAKCESGQLKIPVIKICLEDGRLIAYYVRTDTITT